MKRGRRKKGDYISKEMKEAFERYLECGNRAKVSRELGISQMTLYRWSKKYNWKQKLDNLENEWTSIVADDVLRKRKSRLIFDDPF